MTKFPIQAFLTDSSDVEEGEFEDWRWGGRIWSRQVKLNWISWIGHLCFCKNINNRAPIKNCVLRIKTKHRQLCRFCIFIRGLFTYYVDSLEGVQQMMTLTSSPEFLACALIHCILVSVGPISCKMDSRMFFPAPGWAPFLAVILTAK